MRTPDSMLQRWHTGTLVLCAAALLSFPMAANAQTYSDPIIGNPTPPPEEGDGSSGGGSSGGGSSNPGSGGNAPPSGSSQTGQLTDATGQTATITLDNKALEFESSGRRTGTGLDYDAGLDSAQGGGANGGFPYWEVANAWHVKEEKDHAYCYVDGSGSLKIQPGIQKQDLACYVEWMNGGGKDYVNLAHCAAGSNNEKPLTERLYGRANDPVSIECPAPKWSYGGWSNIKYHTGYATNGETCGTSVGFSRKVDQTRSASCGPSDKYSRSECVRYLGDPNTWQRITQKNYTYKNLGSCSLFKYSFSPRYEWNYSKRTWNQGASNTQWCAETRNGIDVSPLDGYLFYSKGVRHRVSASIHHLRKYKDCTGSGGLVSSITLNTYKVKAHAAGDYPAFVTVNGNRYSCTARYTHGPYSNYFKIVSCGGKSGSQSRTEKYGTSSESATRSEYRIYRRSNWGESMYLDVVNGPRNTSITIDVRNKQ